MELIWTTSRSWDLVKVDFVEPHYSSWDKWPTKTWSEGIHQENSRGFRENSNDHRRCTRNRNLDSKRVGFLAPGRPILSIPNNVQQSIALSWSDIANESDDQLAQKLDNVSVFYRMAPVHKMKIVQAFRVRGDVVAMTGYEL